MAPTVRNRRGRLLAPLALTLGLGLAWGLTRGVAARMGARAPESRLPESAGERLEREIRAQALIRAERTVVMLRSLDADAGDTR